ncbi:hypothetical protein SAMN05216191_11952 [Paenibacillus jilunlii]|uniref:Uncharacterized protein n=1 Tax=Paenibacillus jilunlii TaxID=682956 RepID=A0A1G9WFE4_9BACL|nr:hypothetical protein SAMN05216191_11952 [Paenibacillus jilunlii]
MPFHIGIEGLAALKFYNIAGQCHSKIGISYNLAWRVNLPGFKALQCHWV